MGKTSRVQCSTEKECLEKSPSAGIFFFEAKKINFVLNIF